MKMKWMYAAMTFCVMLPLLATSCSEEVLLQEANDMPLGEPFKLIASNGASDDTRLALGDDGLVLQWDSNDVLLLMDVNHELDPIPLTTTLEAPSEKAVFCSEGGVPSGTYYVVYAGGKSNSVNWPKKNWMFDYASYEKTSSSYDLAEYAGTLSADAFGLGEYVYLAQQIRMYAGPFTIQEGQTMLEVNLKHVAAKMQFEFVNGEDLSKYAYNYIGMFSPNRGFNVHEQLNNGVMESVLRAPKIVFGRQRLEALATTSALILPSDMTGETVYFYVADGTAVYEFQKSGINIEAGKSYTVKLDFNQAKKIEITNNELSKPEHFRALAYHYNLPYGSSYKLTADIDFAGEEYFPISNSISNIAIDGDGHTLRNLTINWGFDGAGLFSNLYNGTLQNLNLENITVIGKNHVGVFAGTTENSTIVNCTIDGCTIEGDNYVGAFCGGKVTYGGGTSISNSKIQGICTVRGKDIVGGIAGAIGPVSDVVVPNTVTIEGENNVGGIAGIACSTITNCGFESTVTATGDYVGGIIGGGSSIEVVNTTSGKATECYSTGTVRGNSYVGGIIGVGTGSGSAVTLCYSTGDVEGVSNVGGISGGFCKITNSYSLSKVSGIDFTGGISGNNPSTIQNCYFAGSVTGDKGIVGGPKTTTAYCKNNVTTCPYLGGELADDESFVNYGVSKPIVENGLSIINGDKVYSTTQIWPDNDAKCPLLLWQVKALSGGDTQVPPYIPETWE